MGRDDASRKAGSGLTIIGFTRYSVDPASIIEPGTGGKPLDALRAALYDPAHLHQRYKLFRAFWLPGLMALGPAALSDLATRPGRDVADWQDRLSMAFPFR